MNPISSQDLRYPIGKFTRPESVSAEERAELLEVLAATPSLLRGAVVGLDHARPVTPDLSAEGAQRFAQVVMGTNAVRR